VRRAPAVIGQVASRLPVRKSQLICNRLWNAPIRDDLVVLADDLIKGDPERIKDISVAATMIAGKIVYEK